MDLRSIPRVTGRGTFYGTRSGRAVRIRPGGQNKHNVRCTDELWAAWCAHAEARGTSAAEQLRLAMLRDLAAHDLPMPAAA